MEVSSQHSNVFATLRTLNGCQVLLKRVVNLVHGAASACVLCVHVYASVPSAFHVDLTRRKQKTLSHHGVGDITLYFLNLLVQFRFQTRRSCLAKECLQL